MNEPTVYAHKFAKEKHFLTTHFLCKKNSTWLTFLYLRKSNAIWTFCSMWKRIFPLSLGWNIKLYYKTREYSNKPNSIDLFFLIRQVLMWQVQQRSHLTKTKIFKIGIVTAITVFKWIQNLVSHWINPAAMGFSDKQNTN